MTRSAMVWNAIAHRRSTPRKPSEDGLTAEERRNLETIVQGARDLNARRVVETSSSFSDDFEWTSPLFPEPLRGPDAARSGLGRLLDIFPDIRFEIESNLARGNRTETIYQVTGTRIDGFLGLPPMEVEYRFLDSVTNEFDAAGQRRRTLEVFDRASLLEQMGVDLRQVKPKAASLARRAGKSKGPQRGLETPRYQPGGGTWRAIEQRNHDSVARGIVAFNRHDVDGSLADLGPESVWRSNAFPEPVVGKRAAIAFTVGFLQQFPDTTFETMYLFAWRDYVQVLFRVRGTKTRGFLGLAPRDRQFEYYRSVLSRYDRRGVRMEVWDVWDEAAVLRDQGAMPWSLSEAERQAPAVGRLVTSLRGVDSESARLTETTLHHLEPTIDRGRAEASEAILRRVANVGMVARLTSSEPIRNDGPSAGEQWTMDLLSTSLRRSTSFWLAGRMASATLAWRTPEAFDGARSQRLQLSGEVTLDDAARSRARLSGVGRTWPLSTEARTVTAFGAVLRPDDPTGALAAEPALITVNGTLPGASGNTVHVALRVGDPAKSLESTSGYPNAMTDGRADDLVVVLAGSADPKRPVQFRFDANGEFEGARACERLSLVDLRSAVGRHDHLITRTRVGVSVGRMTFEVDFEASIGRPDAAAAFRTRDAVLELSPTGRSAIGELSADMVEGFAFDTRVDGVEGPFFRMGGIAPLHSGSGVFEGVEGLLVVNSRLALVPRYISSLLVLRFPDSEGELAAVLARAWS